MIWRWNYTQRNLKSVINVKKIQQSNGERGMHRYIISNSDTVEDVMNVLHYLKYAGYQDEEINVDIVPPLRRWKVWQMQKKWWENYIIIPFIRNILPREIKYKTIMLGFSDGTKDGGYLKANWEIYSTKEKN